MHILVTRPEPFNTQIAQKLRLQGHTVTQAPLMKISYHPLTADNTNIATDAVVITSLQALYMPGIEHIKHLPIWAVGSAEKLQEHGLIAAQTFSNVQSLIKSMPTTLHWLYIRGERITQPLIMPNIKEHIGYTATPAKQWPTDVKWKEIDAVMLMSKETARTFMQLTKPDEVNHITALCHSQAIYEVISSWPWRHIKIGTSWEV